VKSNKESEGLGFITRTKMRRAAPGRDCKTQKRPGLEWPRETPRLDVILRKYRNAGYSSHPPRSAYKSACSKNLHLPKPIRDDQQYEPNKCQGSRFDALRTESGFETPQTRQCFAPAITSAPQPLQAKIKDCPRRSRQNIRDCAADSVRRFDRIPVSVHKAINRVVASRADKRLSLVTKMVIGMRTASC
jgi:hypothetical protein